MESQKRSDEELKEILKKINNKAKKVEEDSNKKLIEKVSEKIVDMPQVQPKMVKNEDLIDNEKFVKSCSIQIQQSPEIKKAVAEQVSRSVLNYKEKEKEEEVLHEDNNNNSNELIANLPLPEGSEIVHKSTNGNGQNVTEQHYILKGKPKQGGFGITYTATYPGEYDGCKVVVKEFYPYRERRNKTTGQINIDYDEIETALWLANFVKEAERIEDLKKQETIDINKLNLVITKTEAFNYNNNWYYIMEYVNGHSLMDILYSFENDEQSLQQLPIACRLQIMKQLCNAVKKLHSIGCIHQDISPNNIMIDFDNEGNIQLKVIDYGLATNLYRATEGSVSKIKAAGTQGFSDVFTREADYKMFYLKKEIEKLKLIDIYSLGAILGCLCLVNLEFLKNKEFATFYEVALKNNSFFQEIEIKEDDNDAVIAAKLQINLIKKLVHDATVYDFEARLQTIEEFSDRLKEIINIDEKWVSKCRKEAIIKTWLNSVDSYSNEIKTKAQDIKYIIESHNDALVVWKSGEKHFEKAENGKQTIKSCELVLDKASDTDLDTLINQISIIDSEYNNAIIEFDKAQTIFDLGVQIDERIVKIKKWVKDVPGLSDRVSRLKSRTEEKAAKNPDAQDNWKVGYNAFIQAENLRIIIEKVNIVNADDKVLDTTIQNITLANNAYNDAESRFNDIKALQPVKPDGNKFTKFIIGVITGIVLSIGGIFITGVLPPENTDNKEIKYINNWLESSYKTSIKELEIQSNELKNCSSKNDWNKANQYLTEAKNIRDEIIGINLGTASDKVLDDIVVQTKIADKKIEDARVAFESIKFDEQNQTPKKEEKEVKKDVKVDLVTEINNLFIKARTDKAARQELKNRMSNDSFIAEVEGEIHSYITSFDSFFSPVYDKYIIGKTHRVIDVVSDSKNVNKIRKVLIDKIN